MKQLEYLNCINDTDRSELQKMLEAKGFAIISFEGNDVKNATDLMNQIGLQLGCQKGMNPKGWDSLRDTLFEVMTTSKKGNVALIWENSDHMLSGELQDFLKACSTLRDVAIATRRTEKANSFFFILGKQPSYRRLSIC